MDQPSARYRKVPDCAAEVMEKREPLGFEQGMHRVEAKAVETIVFEPMQRVADGEGADLLNAIVDGMSPRRVSAGEECRRIAVEVVTFRAEMVVDDIEKNHEPARMRFVDQHPQIVGPTIGAVGRIEQDTVIAPISAACEIGNRHQLDCGYSGVNDVIELVDCCAKRAGGRERADVQLQDGRILPRSPTPLLCAPFELIVIDDLTRPEHILRLEVRGWVGNLHFAVDAILIECAGARTRYGELVPALRPCLQRIGAIQQHLDAVGCRRPEAERDSASVQLGAKARAGLHGEPEKTRIDRGCACAFAPDVSSTPSRGCGEVSKQAVQRLYGGTLGSMNSIACGAALSTT